MSKRIQLVGKHSDHYFTVDDDIFDEMIKYAWWGKKVSRNMYAVRGFTDQNRRYRNVRAHRFAAYLYGILNHWDKEIDNREIDHIDNDGLTNTRENLRAVTQQENAMNMRAYKVGTSQYKGVCAASRNKSNPWQATITYNGKLIYLGCFSTEIDAAKSYDIKAREFGWPESGLNFPDEAFYNLRMEIKK